MKKVISLRRWTRWVMKLVSRFRRQMTAVQEDLRKLGFEAIKTGFAGLVVNGFVGDRHLYFAALVSLVVGLIIWWAGLPRPKPDA